MIVKKLKEMLNDYDDFDAVIFNDGGINFKQKSDNEKHWYENLSDSEQKEFDNNSGDFISFPTIESPYIEYRNEIHIDNIKIDTNIECDYMLIQRTEMIDSLIEWVPHCTQSEGDLIKEDIQYLMSLNDEWVLSSTSTNDYLSESQNPKEFAEECNKIIGAQHADKL